MVIDGAAPLILENCSRAPALSERRMQIPICGKMSGILQGGRFFNLTMVEFINILPPPKGFGASNRGSNYLQWNAGACCAEHILLNKKERVQWFLLHTFMLMQKFSICMLQNVLTRGAVHFKEGPLTKNGPIDFAQSWAIHMKKFN